MSSYRTRPLCPVVLVDRRDPNEGSELLTFEDVRHVFDELAQRFDPEAVADMVIAIENGIDVPIPHTKLWLRRIALSNANLMRSLRRASSRLHGAQPIGGAPETT